MNTRLSRGVAACALLASTALVTPAFAQTAPTFRTLDDNGVDLVKGDFITSFAEGSIGSSDGQLALLRLMGAIGQSGTRGTSQWDHIFFSLVSSTSQTVDFGARMDSFPAAAARGASLTGSGDSWVYRTPDGTAISFTNNEPLTEPPSDTSNLCRAGATSYCTLYPTSITSPDGKVVNLEYGWWSQCFQVTPAGEQRSPDDPWQCTFTARLNKVSNSHGYAINFLYEGAEGEGPGQPPANFHKRTGATLQNETPGSSALSTVSYSYPATGITDVTDIGGRVWRLTAATNSFAVRRPGATADTSTYTTSGGLVTSVAREGVTTNYTRGVSGNIITMTVTNPLSQQTVVTSDATIGRPTSVKDGLNRTTAYQYDASGRPTQVTRPEGNYVQYGFDTRGNVTTTTAVAKAGSGLANVVSSASYDATCTNPKTCNRPNTTTDPLGRVTDYAYDANHGGVLSITAPAPTAGGVRPQTRFIYTLLNGEYRVTGTSACQTLASCTGTADEVKSSLSYDASGNLISTSTGDGSGTLTAAATMTYDGTGNLLTVDGPLPGTADTTRTRYNAAREVIGVIGPDPDATGALKHRATRNTYANALLTKVERGTVNSQSDTDWAAIASLEAVDLVYDANARLTQSKLSGGGTAYALTETSYDALGRPDCSAVRMNSATFASPPASACTLGTQGSFGPDRIARTTYDAAGQVTQKHVAVGTADAATEATYAYTTNGKLQTLKDAENNLTTYEYDGFDRMLKTSMPLPTKGSNASSTTDFEQLSYDAASNVTMRRLRDAQNIAFTYDGLDRPTLKNLPGTEPDVTLAYDNLGRLTSASQTGNDLSFTYDALGRNLSQVGPQGTVASQWDLAGRRTRLTYPGTGLFMDYDYLVTGEPTNLRENGATSGIGVLASFAYDDHGRRTALTRGNGTVTSYGHDPVSRLATLVENATGTTNDQDATFVYNPASQIGSVTRTNDLYAWTGHGSGSTAGVANGLNQLTTIGGAATAHDARGNLTSDPTTGKTYGYSSENMLTTGSGGVTLVFDPLLRLHQVAGAATARFGYDGINMIAEYDTGNTLQRRFVHGLRSDEPLVQYEGAGTADRRWLHADERGSIIAISDVSGNVTTINRYDEYGKPQATNAGRFQYTGQMWLGEVGLYYYKARMYAPHLGRFLQTDPIGHRGGINLYAYVGNDPVNFSDPLGLLQSCWMQNNQDGYTYTIPGATPEDDVQGVVANTYSEKCANFEMASFPAAPQQSGEIVVVAKPQSNGCATPSISTAQRKAAQNGNRSGFWNSRAAAGDPLAGTALSIINNSNFSGQYANFRLRQAISDRSLGAGRVMGSDAISREVQQIGIELMRAHVAAIDAFVSPTTSQIADYHRDVFNAHGIPASTFGGTMLGGAGLTNLITGWAGCRF